MVKIEAKLSRFSCCTVQGTWTMPFPLKKNTLWIVSNIFFETKYPRMRSSIWRFAWRLLTCRQICNKYIYIRATDTIKCTGVHKLLSSVASSCCATAQELQVMQHQVCVPAHMNFTYRSVKFAMHMNLKYRSIKFACHCTWVQTP